MGTIEKEMEGKTSTFFEDAFWQLKDCHEALQKNPLTIIKEMSDRERMFAIGIADLWELYSKGVRSQLLDDLNKIAGK